VPWGIIGGCLAAFVVIIIVAVVLTLLKRRGFFNKKETSSTDGKFVDPLRPGDNEKPDTRYK